MEALLRLKSVLCDQDGAVSIAGSEKDITIIQGALTELEANAGASQSGEITLDDIKQALSKYREMVAQVECSPEHRKVLVEIHGKAQAKLETTKAYYEQVFNDCEARIAAIQAELEAARAEIARLKREDFSHERLQNDSLKLANKVAHEQLAASQAENMRLREVLQNFADSHEECTDFDGFTAQIVSMEDYHKAIDAIASPSDTSALEALVKKVDGLVREQCEQVCFHSAEVNRIRALPAIILEDMI